MRPTVETELCENFTMIVVAWAGDIKRLDATRAPRTDFSIGVISLIKIAEVSTNQQHLALCRSRASKVEHVVLTTTFRFSKSSRENALTEVISEAKEVPPEPGPVKWEIVPRRH
jgi:hypothetical protein